jgi:hypothetical protein
VVKTLLRELCKNDGGKLPAYTHGVAGTLVAAAKEWVKLPADKLELLKALRRKLGPLPAGLRPRTKTWAVGADIKFDAAYLLSR